MKASIRYISELTGFSPATVSNALNHKKGVNAKTAAEVFRVAKEVGYINENSISKIKLVTFKKNGSIIDDTPFFPTLISGFEQECRQCGYEMVLCNLDERDSDYEHQVKNLVQDSESASVILGTEMMGGELNPFRYARSPVVILDYWQDSMDFSGVLINNFDSAKKAVEYLIEQGHREIGYIRGAYRINGFKVKGQGYQSAMRKYKLEVKNHYIITLSTTLNGAYQDMLAYLDKEPGLPTAFFVDNDMIALGAMKALQERGYKVPDDVSIIGFDDLPFSEISYPPLTTLRVPNKEMGRLAVRRLIDMIQNPGEVVVTKTEVCTKFIERQTVKKLVQTVI